MAPDHRPPSDGRRAGLVETELMMAETEHIADEVLAHSEDEDEWEDEPEQIESRPSGTQVISARLPTALAEELLAGASRRKVRVYRGPHSSRPPAPARASSSACKVRARCRLPSLA